MIALTLLALGAAGFRLHHKSPPPSTDIPHASELYWHDYMKYSGALDQPIMRITPTAASRSREDQVVETVSDPTYDVTAYSPTGNRTASGKWPVYGMVASNLWPMGTRLEIEHLGIFTVEDRVGCCTDIDVFVPSRLTALQFGRKHLRVKVLSRG